MTWIIDVGVLFFDEEEEAKQFQKDLAFLGIRRIPRDIGGKRK